MISLLNLRHTHVFSLYHYSLNSLCDVHFLHMCLYMCPAYMVIPSSLKILCFVACLRNIVSED